MDVRIIISAGGTGGHIYPAIAIINKIKEMNKKADILYIGTTDRMEKDIIPNLGIDYYALKIDGIYNKNPFHMLNALYLTVVGIIKCKKIIRKFKPDIVIGVGGYVTVPVLYAAHKLHIKTLLHEQNRVPGKANKFLGNFVDTICVSMKKTQDYFPNSQVVFTGNPRSEEALNAKVGNKAKYGLAKEKKLVLITTGSLGASTINDVIASLLPNFRPKSYQVLLVTGKDNYDFMKRVSVPKNVQIVPYLDDMLGVLKFTDLIVSRAGASTISEITALEIPSILIPSPYVANNHQVENAKELSDVGAAILIEEKDLTKELLLKNIDKIINDQDIYKKMSKSAKKLGIASSVSLIYNEIEKLMK